MSSCEKCWRDAGGDPDRYRDLVNKNNCTPHEQAGGQDAGLCPGCNELTVHLYTHRCVNPDCSLTKFATK